MATVRFGPFIAVKIATLGVLVTAARRERDRSPLGYGPTSPRGTGWANFPAQLSGLDVAGLEDRVDQDGRRGADVERLDLAALGNRNERVASLCDLWAHAFAF